MAKVKITGHASGSGVITVTAPNTSTDRTITLPDATGSLTYTPSIVDGGNATAITIDASEQVGIGQAPTDYQLVVREPNGDLKVLELSTGDSTCRLAFSRAGDPAAYIDMKEDGATGTGGLHFGVGTSNTPATTLKLTSDGRGLSQFTAKGWIRMDGTGTVSIQDSHNVSSIADGGTGNYDVFWDVDLSNANYSCLANNPPDNNAGAYGGVTSTATASCSLDFRKTNDAAHDVSQISVIAFGD